MLTQTPSQLRWEVEARRMQTKRAQNFRLVAAPLPQKRLELKSHRANSGPLQSSWF